MKFNLVYKWHKWQLTMHNIKKWKLQKLVTWQVIKWHQRLHLVGMNFPRTFKKSCISCVRVFISLIAWTSSRRPVQRTSALQSFAASWKSHVNGINCTWQMTRMKKVLGNFKSLFLRIFKSAKVNFRVLYLIKRRFTSYIIWNARSSSHLSKHGDAIY